MYECGSIDYIVHINIKKIKKRLKKIKKKRKIVRLTSCGVGIASSYIAANNLEDKLSKMGYEVKIEIASISQGVKNQLTKEEIENADYVVIAADVAIKNLHRF